MNLSVYYPVWGRIDCDAKSCTILCVVFKYVRSEVTVGDLARTVKMNHLTVLINVVVGDAAFSCVRTRGKGISV